MVEYSREKPETSRKPVITAGYYSWKVPGDRFFTGTCAGVLVENTIRNTRSSFNPSGNVDRTFAEASY